ncbi:MAG: translational machinery protein [Alphaproteobacteria bacterium]|nr:translational machinery protein [Alphaproteobacteria bacterium]
MGHFHAVVWLDHREAHVMHFNKEEFELERIRQHGSSHYLQHAKHLHHKSGTRTGNKAPENQAYYHEIVEALGDAQEWLIVGPGAAKLSLLKHIHRHHADHVDRVVGVETVNHPTDRQLLAHARSYFESADRMRPQTE